MISFRVSEHEFEALRIKSEAEGARSISDFARLALCGSPAPVAARADQSLVQLNSNIQHLSACMQRVTELLERSDRAPLQFAPAASMTKNSRRA